MNKVVIICLLLFFAGCKNSEQAAKNQLIHNELQALQVEIELHIANNEIDSASKKLKRLIHPSSDVSPIRFDDDLTTKEGWGKAMNRSSSNYNYDEYWSEQRSKLLEEIKTVN